jgi:[acyl-carrier-protein] S-malonyltransferase
MGPNRFADMAKFIMVNPFARRLFRTADDVLGYRVARRFRDSDDAYSEAAQVAFFVCCVALAEWARDSLGEQPEVCAGPSFGLKPMTAFSGALPFEDAVRLTARVARCTEEYFTGAHRDLVTLSFVRTPDEQLKPILEDLDSRGEWYDFSCYLDRGFYMITLGSGVVDEMQRRIRSVGGLPLYTMKPPMHSAAFSALRQKALDEVMPDFRFTDPELPVVADSDGCVLRTAGEVREMLLDTYVRAVRWPAVVGKLRELGVDRVCVTGPDNLFGRLECTRQNFSVLAVDPRFAMRPVTRT